MAAMRKPTVRFVLIFLFFLVFHVELGVNKQVKDIEISAVRDWSKTLNGHLQGFTKELTNHIQTEYNKENKTYVQFVKNDGTVLVKEMAKKLEVMLGKKMTALRKIVNAAEDAVVNHTWNRDLKLGDVHYYNAKNVTQLEGILAYNERFLQPINDSVSTVHIPVEIYKGDIDILNGLKWSNALDKAFRENYENDPEILWQYFGSQTGFMRTFPGSKWHMDTEVDLFDVRRRPWYTQGSSSPKDMLILIDTSGSVHGQALSLIKVAVKSILDTLGENDFVNIANFAKNVTFVSCFQTFVQANYRNKKILREGVDQMEARDMANFEKALTFAFDQFDKFDNSSDSGANCNRMIMLLTDGGTDDAENVFKTRNFNRDKKDQIRVFTYAVGQTANPNRGIEWMACANRGKFSEIPAMGAIRARVQGYVGVVARPLALENEQDYKWNSIYLDKLGLGMMTTVTLPVYNKTKSHDQKSNQTILGVMGSDVTTAQMEKYTPYWKLGPNGYSFAINANGYVMFHPKLRVHDDFKDPPNMDFLDIEVENEKKVELRKHMTNGQTGDVTMETYIISGDKNHTDLERRHYYYTNILNTSFSLGISIPSYQQNIVTFAGTPVALVTDGTRFIEDGKTSILVAPWKYVKNGSAANNLSDIYHAFKEWENNGKNQDYWDDDRILHLYWDLGKTKNFNTFFSDLAKMYPAGTVNSTEASFVATYGGLTRIYPADSKYKEMMEGDRDTWQASYFKRALDNDGFIFSAPYTLDKRWDNATVPDIRITKSITISQSNFTPAVVGGFVKHEKILNLLATDTDHNCDEDSNVTCYLLDDGAFMISSNQRDKLVEVGRFFGRVDPVMMHELYNVTYQRLEHFDYQATCTLSGDLTSSAIRLRVPSLSFLFELITVNWWSSIWTWWMSNLSLSSWMNTPVVEAASESDTSHNCIMKQAQYYVLPEFTEISGRIECRNSNCTRDYIVKKLEGTNLLFVIVSPECPGCLDEKSEEMDLIQEPVVYKKESEHFCNMTPRYRRVTEKCYDYHEKEVNTDSYCSGPFSTPVSVAVILIATVITVLNSWLR